MGIMKVLGIRSHSTMGQKTTFIMKIIPSHLPIPTTVQDMAGDTVLGSIHILTPGM